MPGAPKKLDRAEQAIADHAHQQTAAMPAGRGKPAQHARARGGLVEMHRLRVELGGERDDLLAGDQPRADIRSQLPGMKSSQ